MQRPEIDKQTFEDTGFSDPVAVVEANRMKAAIADFKKRTAESVKLASKILKEMSERAAVNIVKRREVYMITSLYVSEGDLVLKVRPLHGERREETVYYDKGCEIYALRWRIKGLHKRHSRYTICKGEN